MGLIAATIVGLLFFGCSPQNGPALRLTASAAGTVVPSANAHTESEHEYLVGQAAAKADVENKTLRIKRSDVGIPWLDLYALILEVGYGIEVDESGDDTAAYARGYNEVSRQAIEHQLGQGVLDRAQRFAESAHRMEVTLEASERKPVRPPGFERYGVTSVYTGAKAPLKLSAQTEAWRFRTAIRDGYDTGAVNFAGHYVAIDWGCGAPCQAWAFVDALSGEVFLVPFPTAGGARFQPKSTLFVADPPQCIEKHCDGPAESLYRGDYAVYYEWTGHALEKVFSKQERLIEDVLRLEGLQFSRRTPPSVLGSSYVARTGGTDRGCELAKSALAALWPEARHCDKDSDCFLYPCSCSSIGNNEAARLVRRFDQALGAECGWIEYLKCTGTTAICDAGRCGIKRHFPW